MSIGTPSVETVADAAGPSLDNRLDEPTIFAPPEKWPMSTSWERAQRETDHGGPLNEAERLVALSGSENARRVLWCLYEGELRAECDCKGWAFNDHWCAHVAVCWWRWVRGDIAVTDLDTGRVHLTPPAWFRRRGGEAWP